MPAPEYWADNKALQEPGLELAWVSAWRHLNPGQRADRAHRDVQAQGGCSQQHATLKYMDTNARENGECKLGEIPQDSSYIVFCFALILFSKWPEYLV